MEPLSPILFLANKGVEFLWLSKRHGHSHIYHYTLDGELIAPITEGNWNVTNIIGIDKQDKNIFFTATTEEDPCTQHVYRVNIISLAKKKLSRLAGFHTPILDGFSGNIIDIVSNRENAQTYDIIDPNGELLQTIKESPSPFTDSFKFNTELFNIKSANDKYDLYGQIIKPTDFDASRKYPIIHYVYGGPQIQKVQDKWPDNNLLALQVIANEGYIVFLVDNRGSYNRSFEFEQSNYLQLGKVEMEDQLKALEHVKKLPFTNANKIGVYGKSFGGFMALYLSINNPEIYTSTISVSPVTNWEYYEIMYTEKYMSTPQENAVGYSATDLISRVGEIKSDLLLMYGLQDKTTIANQSIEFTNACIRNNVLIDTFVFPSNGHSYTGKDFEYKLRKTINHFNSTLQ